LRSQIGAKVGDQTSVRVELKAQSDDGSCRHYAFQGYQLTQGGTLKNNYLARLASSAGIALIVAGALTACGPSAEEIQAQEVARICAEANGLTKQLPFEALFPEPNGDWTEVQNIWSSLKTDLQELSAQASDIDETQLARDFASVSKGAGQLSSVASLITTVGYGSTVVTMEWLDAVNNFTGNEAFQAQNDRTFIGCN
jgi:hypothetical protein